MLDEREVCDAVDSIFLVRERFDAGDFICLTKKVCDAEKSIVWTGERFVLREILYA